MFRSDALRLGLSVASACAVSTAAGAAFADEPLKVTEPSVLREPTEITQVVDAFDGEDPFDLHLSLGYQHTWKSAKVYRETFIQEPGLPRSGNYTRDTLNIAEYSETTSRLNTKAEIGIYQDLALILRLPIILSNERELQALEGSDGSQTVVLQGAPGEQLFRLPFKSPQRSGIEYFAAGLDVAIMNQYRNPTKPTWILGIEGRFNVSEPMHACNTEPNPGLNQPNEQQVDCAHPSDVNRNGRAEGENEGNKTGSRDPGVSRGVTGLDLHTYLSKRIKYIEPYGGFKALLEFQNESSDYGQTDLEGSLVNHPPFEGTMILGLAVIPWEVRDQFQRVTFDFRFEGAYRTEGRDYSELFDALGSSDAPTLRHPNFAKFEDGPGGEFPSVVDQSSQQVYFTGLTDVQQHGKYTFSTQVTWQAGEYVKFNLGGSYTLVQTHYITFDQACNPNVDSVTIGEAGPCRSGSASAGYTANGIPNPNYRRVVNVPGRRFLVDDSNAWNAWLNATVMF